MSPILLELSFLEFPALLLLNLFSESINSSHVSIKYLHSSEADSNTDCLSPQPGGSAWLFVVRISLHGMGVQGLGNTFHILSTSPLQMA